MLLFGALGVVVAITRSALAQSDPCTVIGGKTWVAPADAIACQKSFPFNETLRSNVMSVVSNVFDFYTFEDYYLRSPAPFQESTVNIREKLQELSFTDFATDYDFNLALYNFTTKLNDGHTRWFPQCYNTYQNILPAPVTILEENGVQSVFVIPDLVDLLTLLGNEFTGFLANLGFDWQRLAGARVSAINDMDPFDYIDMIATDISGNYLDHGIRVNSVLSSYRIVSNAYSQRVGDLAGPSILTQTSLRMTLTTANSTKPETVNIPFVSSFLGTAFTDRNSYWTNNCAATGVTNGVDLSVGTSNRPLAQPRHVHGSIIDLSMKKDVGLPSQFVPSLPTTAGSEGVIKSYVLPGNKTGVMFVGSFSPNDFFGFQNDTQDAINEILASGAKNLIIDLHNNGGGFVCLGLFLHFYLAGTGVGFPGFQSTMRANPLARKIVTDDIERSISDQLVFYPPAGWLFPNETQLPGNFNYMSPPTTLTINGVKDKISQRLLDICTPYAVDIPEKPPFDLSKVKIVGNANCASTCALFSSSMFERHNTTFAIFGGKPGESIQVKGMAGNQVLEWADLDTEIKTAGLTNDPLAPPDLLVNGNMRVNWRTAWSFTDPNTPIAYVNEPAQLRFPYTKETYNNPLALWQFAEKIFFGSP
ncbi:hypothetical protein K488DRAFT_59656 [Vararia minispora EC-137]|uniref:Uncharacterized protein n=1 Tax=Vararia minispora EC-137 TaxID=1314806 RepID=A0ACB8Q8C8_9AGAM|nr:hypothetical protein K488DRAFT_59656 [Vararia minispora EC-137]